MRLAIDNGMSVQDVKASVEQAKSQHPLSKGAEMAIEHVLKYLEWVLFEVDEKIFKFIWP